MVSVQHLPGARQRRGVTTLEFALVIPVFFLFILGIIEVGRGFMVTHLLNNAAREGCRTGILPGKSTDNITTAVNNSLSGQGISGYAVSVKVNGVVADASTAQSNDEITVTVSVSAASVTWLPVSKYFKGNLAGQNSLRRE